MTDPALPPLLGRMRVIANAPVRSTAPISHAAPSGLGKPRWSSAAQAVPPLPGEAGFPASTAGLPSARACVNVAPPLSVKTPSLGSWPVTLPVVSPVMLQPAVL